MEAAQLGVGLQGFKMLKRLKNQLERKIASKEPVRYSYDLLVCSLEENTNQE